jgi:hypothetical protein
MKPNASRAASRPLSGTEPSEGCAVTEEPRDDDVDLSVSLADRPTPPREPALDSRGWVEALVGVETEGKPAPEECPELEDCPEPEADPWPEEGPEPGWEPEPEEGPEPEGGPEPAAGPELEADPELPLSEPPELVPAREFPLLWVW